jgi:hypothetical protein
VRRITVKLNNEGKIDRTLRIIVGAALISLVFVGPETLWGWVGLLPLVTGLVGYCPAYTVFGINTNAIKG